jgi:hypothetical protein
MFRKILGICISTIVAASLATRAEVSTSEMKLSAAAIVEKNVAARGGLQAWRSVQTMSLMGKLGAGGNQRAGIPVPLPDKKATRAVLPTRPAEEAQLPFLMELKRNRKMRLEVQFNGQTAVQVFDGDHGWKLRPFLNRRVVEPYTAEETKAASMQQDIDGPLVDYAAKGTKVELVGMEKVEDRENYHLKLTMKNGEAKHQWIDAQTFLETKIEGQPRRLDGIYHPVEIYYRDYRPVNGLQVPYLLETRVLAVNPGAKEPPIPTEKIIVEKVEVNPKLDELLFSKPDVGAASIGKSRAPAGRS